MLDKGKLRNKVVLGLLTSPMTVVPFVVGATMLAGALAFSQRLGLLAFGGLACVMGAVGVALTRFLLGSERQTRKAADELQREAYKEHERRLDELDRRLVQDRDPRTEAALRDLRAFEQAFRKRETWSAGLNATSAFDIVSSVHDLFEGCVKALESSTELWETAQRLRTPEAREPILERREEVVRDVHSSVEKLSRIMIGIQGLGSTAASETDLSRLRADLDANLAIAERVEEKMRSWQDQSFEIE